MLDLLATGYPSLDHILSVSRSPAVGETAILSSTADDRTATYGGCGANVAVGLRRLGLQTGVAVVLGDDEVGQGYRDYLSALDVDCHNLTMLRGEKSSQSYLFRNPDGEYQIFFFAGAADAWTGTLNLQGLDDVRWGLVTVGQTAYNIQFARLLSERQIPLAWQLKPDIAAYPREALEHFVQVSRIIFCNQFEADFLCKLLGLNDVRDVFARGVEVIALTLGKDGARLMTPQETISVTAVKRDVIDTTGAGDAFTAGFLAGYMKGADLRTCGQLGAVTASFVIEQTGCQTGLPDWDQLQARYIQIFGM